MTRLLLSLATLALMCSTSLSACDDPATCSPSLCVADKCESTKTTLTEGQGVVIAYRLPAGVRTSENVKLRVETPCACAVFSRKAVSSDDADPDFTSSCDLGLPLEIPLVVPEGGACRLSVTVEVENDLQTVTLGGGDCEKLSCTSDVKCAEDLSSDAGSGGGTSP